MSELALDGNPVTNKEGYFQFCIKNCPSLKNLDMMKITQEMRDNIVILEQNYGMPLGLLNLMKHHQIINSILNLLSKH